MATFRPKVFMTLVLADGEYQPTGLGMIFQSRLFLYIVKAIWATLIHTWYLTEDYMLNTYGIQ